MWHECCTNSVGCCSYEEPQSVHKTLLKDTTMTKDVREVRRSVENADDGFTDIYKENAPTRYASPEYDYRSRKFPIRTGIAAISLFALGSILIYVSTLIGLDGERRGLSFFILGLIAFIPGSYATVQLYGSYKGWKGYDYSQVPSYDD